MNFQRIAIVAVALGLAACASTSPKYLPADSADGAGHYSTKLADDRYRVVYNGDPRTGRNTTRDYALLRASEITLREGYDWFRVVDRETVTETTERAGSGVSYERAYVEETSCGLLGCTRRSRPTTRAGMEIESGRPVTTTYSHALEIVMGRGELPADGDYYDAREVSKSLIDSI